MQNRTKYIIFYCIGFSFVVFPTVVYNVVNYKIFIKVSAMKLTFSALLGFSMIGIAALTKMKSKNGIYAMFVGVLLAVLGEASTQIGYSLLLIGGGTVIDKIIFSRIALSYKVKWYVESGREVIYTKEVG